MNGDNWPILFAIFAFAGFVVSLYNLVQKYRRNRLLETRGVLANAIVTRRREIRAKYLNHEIDYQFEANGQRYECPNRHVYADTYSRLKEGATVQIRYLASNPAQSKIAGNYDASDYNWGLVALFLFMTVGAFVLTLFPKH